MSISQELYSNEDNLLFEEELLRNPFNLKQWWHYLIARAESPFNKRALIYERALKALPLSYKLWHAYLRERLELVKNLPITHSQFESLNNTFERALITMHKMPNIWILYLQTLIQQKRLGQTRQTFDRALRTLPVTQHDRIWELYILFVTQKSVPIETSLRVYRRYLLYDPSQIEYFIDFLMNLGLWQEAAEKLASLLNDDQFYSNKGKTREHLWKELCGLLSLHATEISGLDVDAIIRSGISQFSAGVGWTSLASYYIRRNMQEKARDIFEEGMMNVVSVSDFSVICDAYSQFEQSILDIKIKNLDVGDEEDDCGDFDYWVSRFEHLINKRPELLNSVLLRQNPHNVELWHSRIKLFEGNPTKQILTYTEAVRTVDPVKALGKVHTLWVAFAKLYESGKDIVNARVIFDRAVLVKYESVDDLASVWCEWAEMELRHSNFKGVLELMERATAEPSVEVKQIGNYMSQVQMKLYTSVKMWSFYVDLEESLGTLESTRTVYERILDLRIATPQIIINYAMLLEEHNFFDDAFKVYERGVKMFKYPHVKDIWVTYLTKFVKRYGKMKLEWARELFDRAVEEIPAEAVKPFYLEYARLEEECGLVMRAMKIYNEATKVVPVGEKLSMYELYIARVAETVGAPKTREIYEEAIKSDLPDKDVKGMCLKYVEMEMSLGEINRARGIYVYAAQLEDSRPRSDIDFWNKWQEFEVQYGNEDTFREMVRIKRSVSVSYHQVGFPEYLMVNDEKLNLDENKEKLSTRLRFVGGRLELPCEGMGNHEDVDLLEVTNLEDDGSVAIAQKRVPGAVFGGLVQGIKRQKQG